MVTIESSRSLPIALQDLAGTAPGFGVERKQRLERIGRARLGQEGFDGAAVDAVNPIERNSSARNAATASSLAALSTALDAGEARNESHVARGSGTEAVGRLEGQRHQLFHRAATRPWRSGRGAQAERDGRAHIGSAELREDGLITEVDHGVDDTLRVDDDLDLFGRRSNS